MTSMEKKSSTEESAQNEEQKRHKAESTNGVELSVDDVFKYFDENDLGDFCKKIKGEFVCVPLCAFLCICT